MKGRRMIRKREGGGGGMQEEVVRHWPVSFWVRGGDKTGEHGNRELMRDKEGERKAVKYTVRRLRGCFHHVCKTGTVQLSEGMEGEGGRTGLSPLGVYIGYSAH